VASSSLPAVRLKNVSRHFGEVKALDDISLDILDGEFFSLLGPSGSGKTTCLRLIAGFDLPTAGLIELHGKEVGNLPPYEREVNTVFQDYALFPHMSVGENIAYGLMIASGEAGTRRARMKPDLQLAWQRKPARAVRRQRQRVAGPSVDPAPARSSWMSVGRAGLEIASKCRSS
jgi:putative spermidine/putrescine transport system ATP-binding protein